MVKKHVILLGSSREELSDAERQRSKRTSRRAWRVWPGDPRSGGDPRQHQRSPSSNADLMLDTTFEFCRGALRAIPLTRPMLPWPTARCAPY